MTAPVLHFEQVEFAYDPAVPVLRGVSLAVQPGEGVAVLGANGAGKSTLLRLAMALARPLRGRVTSAGFTTAQHRPEQLAARVGYVFQHPEDQLFAPTVAEELAFGPRLLGWSEAQVQARTAELLTQLGLEAAAARHPYDLPMPARRLVAVACALMMQPALVLMDEPSAGLDDPSRRRLAATVRVVRRAGAAVVAVTHDAEFAIEALDRAIVLDSGLVARDGALDSVLHSGLAAVPRLPLAQRVVAALGLVPASPRFDDAARVLGAHLADG